MTSKLDSKTRLFQILENFLTEYNSSARARIHLESSLDQDLGIDSLGRIELFHRIEDEFKLKFTDDLMFDVLKVEDILKALEEMPTQKEAAKKQKAKVITEKSNTSDIDYKSFYTLVDALEKRGKEQPNSPHIYFQDHGENESIITYGELYQRSLKIAEGFKSLGLEREETVSIMLPTCPDFFSVFFGILLAGGVPVPIYPPLHPSQMEEYIRREVHILTNAEIKFLITFDQADSLSKLLKNFIPSMKKVLQVSDLECGSGLISKITLSSKDSALIQYTSGSTANPKGVLLSHANLISNVRSIGEALDITSKDVVVSWLPLYHDMGLIGTWLGSLYHGIPVCIMPPLSFISRPERWLWTIHTHRATLSSAPNFAYEMCATKIKDEDIEGLDLSSWRLALNGAEEVHAETLRKFTKRFKKYGLRPESLLPVYGLAESSVALTFPPINRKPLIDRIKRKPFEEQGEAIKAESKDKSYVEVVSCGKPIPRLRVRIVDDQLNELPDRKVGRLQFKGPSCMQGYYHSPEKTKEATFEGWIDSGDLAYSAEGEFYVTGRIKDIIIKAGRNLYPQEIEEIINEIPGVRKGNVIAFGIKDEKTRTERLIIVSESRIKGQKAREDLIHVITEKVTARFGEPPDEVVLAPLRTVPKTSSGKLMRSKCKQLYLENKLIRKKVSTIRVQAINLFMKSAWQYVKKATSASLGVLYGVYVCLLVLIMGIPHWISILIFPPKINRITSKYGAMLLFFFARWRISVKGRENIPDTKPVIFIANHMSYIDSLLLTAVLPSNVSFTGKQEIAHNLFLLPFMKRLDHILVERKASTKSVTILERLKEAIIQGRSLIIFPEGTFSYANRIRQFRLGAFKVSAETDTPLVPIVIKGTRSILREIVFPPKVGEIEVSIKPQVLPHGTKWKEILKFRDEARKVITSSFEGEAIE